ncbi:MAG TPA: protein kinase [Nannocystis sp.]
MRKRTGPKGKAMTSSQQVRSTGKVSLEPPVEWDPPETFDEYRLIRLLGRGTMGRVYLAHDTVLDRPVAVKFIGHVAPDVEDRERFLVEARAVARIQHPNVVTIHRVGQLEGHPYLITEYVRGQNLSEIQTPLAWRKVLDLAIGLARGLAAAHRQGVLHRDIKLANAILSETGEVKLLDFSLAKLVDPAVSDQALVTAREAEAATSAADLQLEGRPPVDREAETLKPGDLSLRSVPGGSSRQISPAVSSAALSAAGLSAAGLSGALSMSGPELTQVGTLLGTPHYMAPELWRAEPATRRSDVYALGVLMYILLSGRPPTEANSTVELATRLQEQEPRPLLERAPRCDPRLAAIVDRCLRADPALRFASADELLAALEALSPMSRELAIPEGNPYRGLQAFESKHRALFFGRAAEIRAVLERLRAETLVVVAGDSGVGKSSLCKAGVAPMVEEGYLDPTRKWAVASMTPGRYPLQTFVSTMAALFDMTEEALSESLAVSADEFVRTLRKQLGEAYGRLLFIDQFEELTTLSAASEVEVLGPLLARLAAGLPGLRLLATVRGDFLTRVAQIPGIGDDLARAIYILRPLSPEGAREAIVGPARVKGVSFASEALIDELVEAGRAGSLPLLQFALAELWEIRDEATNVISAADLKRIGGVSGALARHGDATMAALIPEQRAAARRILMRLVTVDDTRAVRTEEELVAGSPAAEMALKALVRSRLVVVREVADQTVFEIAHEALLKGWSTLSTWLEEERESRAIRHRLELAVADWERLHRSRDALWSGAQLVEALQLDAATLRPKEREFIAASQSAAARVRALRRAAIVLVPVVAVATYGAMWLKSQADLRRRVDAQVAAAAEERAAAERARAEAEELRTAAFASFDRGEAEEGEALWSRYAAAAPKVEQRMARAAQQLETALSLDLSREDVRERLAEVLFQRALLAERAGHGDLVLDDLLARLALYDTSGAHRAAWDAPAELTVASEPAGAKVTLERYADDGTGRRVIDHSEELGVTPVPAKQLARGSYRLRFELPGRAPVVYPILLGRGETQIVNVTLLPADRIPAGFVHVPAGRFLYGCGESEVIRRFFVAEPEHVVETGDFLIARHEVTYGDFIAYLEDVSPEERARVLGPPDQGWGAVRLSQVEGGGWRLELRLGTKTYTAVSGEQLVYEGRTDRTAVDWLRLPVSGLSSADAALYLAWLDRTGRVPGARFCDEREWERAARGADQRQYAHGDVVAPEDANTALTYQRVATAMAPDPVGLYPLSESPFGLYDTVGNVFEMTVARQGAAGVVARGGAFAFDPPSARASNRQVLDEGFRDPSLGLRVCASVPGIR